MSENLIVLRGKVKEFARSESGNLAFMLEDKNGDIRYCFSTSKKPFINISDDVIILGSVISGAKVRINYIINKTRNTEDNLIESKADWTYYTSLILAILVTVGFVISILVLIGIIPIGTGSIWDPINSIFTMVISLVLLILFIPLMIILWGLTVAFTKKKTKGSELENEVLKIKQELSDIQIKAEDSIPSKPTESLEGEEFTSRGKFCSHCGEKLPSEAKFCPKCGSKW